MDMNRGREPRNGKGGREFSERRAGEERARRGIPKGGENWVKSVGVGMNGLNVHL